MQILTAVHWTGIFAHVNLQTKQRVIIHNPTFRQNKEKQNENRKVALPLRINIQENKNS